jgi:transcriptional regulator with XRE-family HTH domain
MAHVPGPDTPRLVAQTQLALGLTQRQLGDLLSTSRRTVSRWASRKAHPTVDQLQVLARAVHAKNAALAAALAAEAGETLEGLGLVLPPSPAVPSPLRPLPPARLIAESVVCAAAEAMQAAPAVVREVLRAAFARAQALGLSVEEMNEALSPVADGAPARGAARVKRAAGG